MITIPEMEQLLRRYGFLISGDHLNRRTMFLFREALRWTPEIDLEYTVRIAWAIMALGGPSCGFPDDEVCALADAMALAQHPENLTEQALAASGAARRYILDIQTYLALNGRPEASSGQQSGGRWGPICSSPKFGLG